MCTEDSREFKGIRQSFGEILRSPYGFPADSERCHNECGKNHTLYHTWCEAFDYPRTRRRIICAIQRISSMRSASAIDANASTLMPPLIPTKSTSSISRV